MKSPGLCALPDSVVTLPPGERLTWTREVQSEIVRPGPGHFRFTLFWYGSTREADARSRIAKQTVEMDVDVFNTAGSCLVGRKGCRLTSEWSRRARRPMRSCHRGARLIRTVSQTMDEDIQFAQCRGKDGRRDRHVTHHSTGSRVEDQAWSPDRFQSLSLVFSKARPCAALPVPSGHFETG
jgi:hypothetical protein